MADPTMHEVLARLEAQDAKVAALQVELSRYRRKRRTTRRLIPALIVAVLVALVPLTALADFAFLDLNSGSPHNDNIKAIADAGITKGCNPPINDNYCPNDFVTREQMASFLARTAGLGTNPPVANALTAVSAQGAANATHATSADTATTATTAATLAGYAPNGLVRLAGAQQAALASDSNVTPTVIVQVTLTTPGPGYVLVNGACDINLTTGSGTFSRVWLRDVTASVDAPALSTTLVPSGSGDYSGAFSPTAVFTVPAGGQRTFALLFRTTTSNTTQQANHGAITALYVPFGPAGSPPPAP